MRNKFNIEIPFYQAAKRKKTGILCRTAAAFVLGAALSGCTCSSMGNKKMSKVNFSEMWLEKNIAVREKIQDVMQSYIDKTPKREFDDFDNDPQTATSNPVLQYYDQALERIANDIKATEVVPGKVVFWYLYNLGFVIKTPDVCFGVDIHHRHAEKLADFLDFAAITHNHDDHYNIPFMQKMTAQRKMVISNFFPNQGYTKFPFYTHKIKNVTVHCYEADHSPSLKNFTMPLEIICPTGDKEFVFFTSGDCYDHKFLKKTSKRIDLYAVHPRCTMVPVEAAKVLDPEVTFISHLQELGHEINRFRWQFTVGREEVENFKKINKKAYIPVWGEKFIWDGEKITGCQE